MSLTGSVSPEANKIVPVQPMEKTLPLMQEIVTQTSSGTMSQQQLNSLKFLMTEEAQWKYPCDIILCKDGKRYMADWYHSWIHMEKTWRISLTTRVTTFTRSQKGLQK